MSHDEELMKVAGGLEAALGADKMALAGVDPAELCKTYRKARPWIERAIVLIEMLPWGGPVAKAIRLLMTIADQLCPV
jgi:hypothetical protein